MSYTSCRKIQSVFELSDGSGLVVTVARYETPAHTDIDKVCSCISSLQKIKIKPDSPFNILHLHVGWCDS